MQVETGPIEYQVCQGRALTFWRAGAQMKKGSPCIITYKM